MPARFDQDRRRLAYLFGGAAVLAFGYLTITQPTLLGYGPTIAIGGFVAAAMALLGVNPARRNGGQTNEQQAAARPEKRQRPPRESDSNERRMVGGRRSDDARVAARRALSVVQLCWVRGLGGGVHSPVFA